MGLLIPQDRMRVRFVKGSCIVSVRVCVHLNRSVSPQRPPPPHTHTSYLQSAGGGGSVAWALLSSDLQSHSSPDYEIVYDEVPAKLWGIQEREMTCLSQGPFSSIMTEPFESCSPSFRPVCICLFSYPLPLQSSDSQALARVSYLCPCGLHHFSPALGPITVLSWMRQGEAQARSWQEPGLIQTVEGSLTGRETKV